MILSLVTTPDRASSTVGDLLEEAGTRGPHWFWSSIFRTTGSHIWRDFRSAPILLAWLGFWGWLATWVFAAAPLIIIALVTGGPDPNTKPLAWWLLEFAAFIVASVHVGWEVAARSKGRELAAAFSLATVIAAFYAFAEYASAMQLRRIGRSWPGRGHALAEDCIEALFVLVAAIMFRLKNFSPPVVPTQPIAAPPWRMAQPVLQSLIELLLLEYGLALFVNMRWGQVMIGGPPKLESGAAIITDIAIPFFAGWRMAKRANTRELAAASALAAAYTTLYFAKMLQRFDVTEILIQILVVFAAAVLFRRTHPVSLRLRLSQDDR